MKRLILSVCLILLSGCSPALTQTPPSLPATELSITPTSFGNCAYRWAYEDLPELSAEFQTAIQELQPPAQASAFAFGEDCVYTDGHATFTAMETDFNVTLQVNNISDDSELGEWTVKVMQVILNIPDEKIIGPQPGRATFTFQSTNAEEYLNFYVSQYEALTEGLSHAEIYQALQTP